MIIIIILAKLNFKSEIIKTNSKTQMKRIITKLGMIMAVLLSFFPVSAYDFETEGAYYTILSFTDFTVKIDGIVNKDITEFTVPKTVQYNGKELTVVSIGDYAFKESSKLEAIVLPETIGEIGKFAFIDDSSLIKITLPDNLSTISLGAFSGCVSLKSISIPDKITKIESKVFQGCSGLEEIKLSDSISTIGSYAFESIGCSQISLPHGLTNIEEGAFKKSKLKYIKIPSNVTTIPCDCFAGCDSLNSVDFNVSRIESRAFSNCISISKITLPENLQFIGEEAFYGCSSLHEFIIPDNVTEMHPSVLWKCDNIDRLKIGTGLDGMPFNYKYKFGKYNEIYTLGSYRYYYSGPHDNWKLSDESFLCLGSLKEVIIDDSYEPFSMRSFYYEDEIPPFSNADINYYYVGRELKDIKNFSVSSTSFGIDVKQGFGHINTLVISGNCIETPYFYQKVDTLILGENIERYNIGNIYADDLKKIVCESSLPPTIEPQYNADKAFASNIYTSVPLYVPAGSIDYYRNAEGWKNFWNIIEIETSKVQTILNDDYTIMKETGRYDLNGMMVTEDYKGIVIVRFSDGSARKMLQR